MCYLFNARKIKLKTIIDPSQNFIPTDKISAIHNPNTRRHFFLFFSAQNQKTTSNKKYKRKGEEFFLLYFYYFDF
jgi:hypothetical protein